MTDPRDLARRLEQTQWDTFWVPSDCTVIDRRELLMLACPSGAEYLNVVLRIDDTASLPNLLAEVARAHAGRDSRVHVAERQREHLVPALRDAGYEVTSEHHGYVRDTSLAAPKTEATCERVTDMDGLLAWERVNELAFGPGNTSTHAQREHYLAQCADPGGRVHRFLSRIDGEPAAAGGMTLFPALDLAFLWGGGSVPELRHRGAYAAVVSARAAFASARGIHFRGAFGRVATSGPILHRQGFTRLDAMDYWTRPASKPAV